jgi:NADPH2:quinone reductase
VKKPMSLSVSFFKYQNQNPLLLRHSLFLIPKTPLTKLTLKKSSLITKSSFSSSSSEMVKAIRVHELGGPQVLKWEDVEIGEPKEGEVRVKNKAIGVNFIDVYFRKGVYNASSLPFTPGFIILLFIYDCVWN